MSKKSKWLLCVILFISIIMSGTFIIKFSSKKEIKYDDLINISELSDEFMQDYFEGVEKLQKNSNQENILIVTSLNGIADSFGATDVVAAPNNQYFLQYANEKGKEEALQKFNDSKEILYVGENIIYTAYEAGYNSWGIEKMGLDKAIEVSNSNNLNEVVVAIIDSGCNVTQIENNYPGKIKGSYNVLTSGTSVPDDAGHGTHVAGTIAEGTPNNVKIFPIRASLQDNPGHFNNMDIITAINYVVYDNKAQVINMSFGGDRYDENMLVAITAANNNNIISVAAAGNDSTSIAHYPSGYDNTISISAVDSDLKLADYSNYGQSITFSAPGTNILSVNGTKSGTSMAAPHASSAVAIIKSYYPNYSMQQVIDELKKYSIDLGQDGWDSNFGYGFINFNGAPLCELNEGCIFKQGQYSFVKKIEANSVFITRNNFASNSNILNAKINVYYNNIDYYTKALWELDDVEILNYEPEDFINQVVTIRYKGFECQLNVDNSTLNRRSFSYEVIDEDNKFIRLKEYKLIYSEKVRKLIVPEVIDGYTVTEIGEHAIVWADSIMGVNSGDDLYYVDLPDSITKIGKYAFNMDINLIEVKFPINLEEIDDGAFYGCASLQIDNLPEGLLTIGDNAFRGNHKIKTLNLPSTVTTIGSRAFEECWELDNIYISKNVVSISPDAFYDARHIEEIIVDPENPIYDSRNNSNTLNETATNTLIQGSVNAVIPNTIRVIGANSFYGVNISEIDIPEGVVTIDDNAFANSKLIKALIPETVISIGLNSFIKPSIESKTVLWVYKNSYSDTFVQDNNIVHSYRDTDVYDINVNLLKTEYEAFESVMIDDVTISLVYYNKVKTEVPYDGDAAIVYNTDNSVRYGDTYVTFKVVINDITFKQKAQITVTKAMPIYEIPNGLVGETNTLLSSVVLPENFEWMNPNQLITVVGNQTFKAKYVPVDFNNYQIIENIDVPVSVSKGKDVIVPNIQIANKTYDGTTNIDLSSITISNLNIDEYTIENIVLLTPGIGTKDVIITIRLSDDKFTYYAFEGGIQEKTFSVNVEIVPQELIKPTKVNKTYTYSGMEQMIELNGFDSDKMNITGNTRINAGMQDTVISLKSSNYVWSDNSTEDVILNFTINKAEPIYEIPNNLNGKINNTLSTVELPSGFEWMNPAQAITEVGNQYFKARYIPIDTNNYEIVENIDIPISVSNTKSVVVPNIQVSNKNYDGTTNVDLNSITISNLNNDEYTIQSATLANSNVGNTTATIVLRLSNEKFNDYMFEDETQEKEFTVNVEIIPQELTKPTKVEKTYTYNGEEQTIELNNFDSSKMSIEGNKRTDAGNQNVVISLKNSNYTWNDNTTVDVILDFVINKAEIDVQDNTQDVIVNYDNLPHILSLSLNNNSSFIIKYMDANEEYILSDCPSYVNVGVYTIKYKVYIDENYTEYFGQKTITISSKRYIVTFYANNGTTDSVEQEIEESINTKLRKNTFIKNNYTFKEWNTKANGTGSSYADEKVININANLSLYAIWEEVFDYSISNYVVNEKSKYISKIMVNTEVNKFKSNITLGSGYGVNVAYKTVNNKQVLYTGGKTKITKGSNLYREYTNIVIGDINGDGAINSADLLKIRQHLLGINILSGVYFISSDINYDSNINSADLLRVRQHLLGTKPIE